jgi:AraC-like DNA-binding protein
MMTTAIAPLPTRLSPVSSWSSLAFADRERYDAWVHALSDFFLPWTVTSRGHPAFSAKVRQRELCDSRLIYCASDPVSGERRSADMGRTRGDFFNVLYVLSGMERLKFQGREVILRPGHFVLWDTQRPMDFEVLQPLEKLTLMIPERQLRSVFPNAADYVGVPVDGSHGLGGIFADHLRSLAQQIWRMSEGDVEHLLSPTLELFANSYASVAGSKRPSLRQTLFQRAREFITAHLADPGLSPQKIADAHRISLRYLQMLFADTDTTVSGWIRQQRLERCRMDLANPQLAHQSVTEIAYRWGFNDLGHFGKAFRKVVGSSPSEYRQSYSSSRKQVA